MRELFPPGRDERPDEEATGSREAELADGALVTCPYCGEAVEIVIDVFGGASQEYIEDCEVCCRPWSVRVSLGAEGDASVLVTALDDV